MRKLIALFVDNSILVNFTTVFILVVGIMSIFSIQKELRPAVSIDKIYISTVYTGASPEEVEKLVTIPIEEKLSAVYGIKRIESLSYNGISNIVAELDPDVKNKSEVVQDIFRTVDNVKDLPEDIHDDPMVREIKSQVFPIYGVALYGNVDRFVLRKWARILRDELNNLKGVSSSAITGVRDPTIDVVVKPKQLQRQNISVSEIMDIIKNWNKTAPAGYIRDSLREIPMRISEELDELTKISGLVVRTNDMGKKIFLREVADVSWGFKNDRKLNRYNGKQNVQITISKMENADTIKTVARINKLIQKFEGNLPKEINTLKFRDDSERIKTKLGSVNQNALLGLFLVVFVLLIMLNWRIALVTALGLPVAFFGAIWALELMGYTLNSMTIIGIILVVGMLVDDGIVVAENIFYRYEKGASRRDAAIEGTREIIVPVIGTILTTICAFSPLVFMSGIIGKFMSIIPVAVITCLVFSLLECIFILPNHAAEFMGRSKSKIAEFLNRQLMNIYGPALAFVVHRRWLVAPMVVLMIAGAGFYYFKNFKMTMFPVKGVTKFSFNIEAPANTRLSETDRVVRIIEKQMNQHMGKYITGYRSKVGALDGRHGLSYSGANTAGFRVYLEDEEKLDIAPRKLVQRLRKDLKPLIPEGWKFSFEVGRHGPPMGKAVEIEVGHHDYDKIKAVATIIEKRLKEVDGVADVQTDLLEGFTEYVLQIDQERATMLGVNPSQLQRVVMSSFEGLAATRIRKGNDEYEVMVLYPEDYREDKSSVLNLQIKTKYNTYIPLGTIATLLQVESLGVIKHIDEKKSVVVMASLSGKKITGQEVNRQMQLFVDEEISSNYPDVLIKFAGEEEKRREMLLELAQLFFLALLGIYMVLSLVFGSPFYPFFVIVMIPFGLLGGLTALAMYGQVVSIPGLISFVGLTGVVVNDAIILVIYIRDRFRENKDMIGSIIAGGKRRLRPIFLTTITTFTGLLPAIYELGGQDANMKPMAIVMAWGLMFATIMTMLFIPSFMGCLHDIKMLFIRRILKR